MQKKLGDAHFANIKIGKNPQKCLHFPPPNWYGMVWYGKTAVAAGPGRNFAKIREVGQNKPHLYQNARWELLATLFFIPPLPTPGLDQNHIEIGLLATTQPIYTKKHRQMWQMPSNDLCILPAGKS